MNKFLKRILCFGMFVPFSIINVNFSSTIAMENEFQDMSKSDIEMVNKWMQYNNHVGSGNEGAVYKCPTEISNMNAEYKDCVLKYSETHLIDNDVSDQDNLNKNMECLKKLQSKPLTENLMKVIRVLNKHYVVLEYIDGFTYESKIKKAEAEIEKKHFPNGIKYCEDFSKKLRKMKEEKEDLAKKSQSHNLKLGLDFFIEKWCIGLFEGISLLIKETGKPVIDIHGDNIIVRNKVPVLIDYCFRVNDKGRKADVGGLVRVLLDALNTEVNENERKNAKAEALREYFNTIKDQVITSEKVDEILKKLNEIKSS